MYFAKEQRKNSSVGGFYSRCKGSVGLVPELSVAPPVGHVRPDRMSPLLPQNLFYQVGTGHIHHNHRPVFRLPDGTIDFLVFNLRANKENYWVICWVITTDVDHI